jgi:hypothetical protein
MLLKPLKRVSLPESSTAELVEPSAGTATAFISKLGEFPKVEEDRIEAKYFSGLRALICLYDNGKPFLPQLVNHLHESSPAEWQYTVVDTDSPRQILEALDVSFLQKLVDYFLDTITATQLEEINTLIRTQVWPDKERMGN